MTAASLAGRLLAGACPAPIRETDRITIGHGSGGRLTTELLEQVVLPILGNPLLDRLEDSALLPEVSGGRIAMTTDSFVVSPIFFPGGDIGELAVNGTVNDLAVGGARPLGLSLAMILEEGLPMADLRRVVESVRRAANRAGVSIVTGDTKVVGRGHGDQIFLNTTGIGVVPEGVDLGTHRIRPGDVVLVSGTLGDHGVAVLSRRSGLEFDGARSDTAPLHQLCGKLIAACPGLHAMRDPTRGGLAATLTEVATRRALGVVLDEERLPLSDVVRGASELLGLDPLHIANEGKLVAFVAAEDADVALGALREHPLGRDAACIGHVTSDHPRTVVVNTRVRGRRILELPHSEPLPRIC